MTETTLGWDVGGAHLKAALLDAGGRVVGAWQEPCPLWRGLGRLGAALDRIEAAVPARGAARRRHAVTMTGEMADLFESRAAGVAILAERLAARFGAERTRFYAGPSGWLDWEGARRQPDRVASANWHASAALVARRLDAALLVDIGSTTTDLIPVRRGRPATDSVGDADRLAAGELVYTGVVRTPVMALAAEAPVAGRWLPLMAEHFATSADVYRVLGWLPAAADRHDSADGGAKTVAASRVRLARMVGRDAGDLPDAAWSELAAWCADAQLERIQRAARQVLSRVRLEPGAPVLTAGAGAFLAERLAARLGRPAVPFAHLLGVGPELAQAADWCAPALAVARLMADDDAATPSTQPRNPPCA